MSRAARAPSAAVVLGTSASRRARNDGSCNACACSATGNPATSRQAGNMRTGGTTTAARRATRPGAAPPGRGWAAPRPPTPRSGVSSSRHASGWRWLCASESESGRPDAGDDGAHQLELAVGVGEEVGDELDHPVPGIGHAERRWPRARRHLARSDGVGSPLAVLWFSVREVEKPTAPARMASAAKRAHGRRVLRRRIFQAGGPFPHDVEAQGAVGELGAQVDVVRPVLHGVEIFAEGLPRPLDALVEHGARDVLDALHQRDQLVVRVRAHRREPDAAVAHHRGGHAVPARGGETRVPRGLAVVVGVDVDEARRHQQARGVDLLVRPAADRHRGDGAAVDGDVGGHRFAAPPVGHVAAPDHQVVAMSAMSTPFASGPGV